MVGRGCVGQTPLCWSRIIITSQGYPRQLTGKVDDRLEILTVMAVSTLYCMPSKAKHHTRIFKTATRLILQRLILQVNIEMKNENEALSVFCLIIKRVCVQHSCWRLNSGWNYRLNGERPMLQNSTGEIALDWFEAEHKGKDADFQSAWCWNRFHTIESWRHTLQSIDAQEWKCPFWWRKRTPI